MKHFVGSVLLGISVFFSPLALSLSYEDAARVIESFPEGISYNEVNHGYLCEQLAIAKLSEFYPSERILGGVIYRDDRRTYGELDVLIVDRNFDVSHVVEVKCMKSYRSALSKAQSQLDRFDHYAGRCDLKYVTPEGQLLDCGMFQNEDMFLLSMSYEDALPYGFDLSFDLTRDEVLDLIHEH